MPFSTFHRSLGRVRVCTISYDRRRMHAASTFHLRSNSISLLLILFGSVVVPHDAVVHICANAFDSSISLPFDLFMSISFSMATCCHEMKWWHKRWTTKQSRLLVPSAATTTTFDFRYRNYCYGKLRRINVSFPLVWRISPESTVRCGGTRDRIFYFQKSKTKFDSFFVVISCTLSNFALNTHHLNEFKINGKRLHKKIDWLHLSRHRISRQLNFCTAISSLCFRNAKNTRNHMKSTSTTRYEHSVWMYCAIRCTPDEHCVKQYFVFADVSTNTVTATAVRHRRRRQRHTK